MKSSKPAPLDLDPRLAMVALHVREGTTLADIGTDHGMLPVSLILNGKIKSAVCADINEKPLKKAEKLVSMYNLSDKIRCVLSDGLDMLTASDADDIVMAGMGGELIATLLSRAPWLKDSGKKLILQPMSRPQRLRRYLYGAGFSITQEDGVCSKGMLYTVISAQYTNDTSPKSLADEYVGRLGESSFPESVDYIRKTAQRLTVIGDGLSKSNTNSINSEKYYEVAREVLSHIVEK